MSFSLFRSAKAKNAAPETPPLAEIVLSKTTVTWPTSMPLKKRIWWLKYELPSSLSASLKTNLWLTAIVPLMLLCGSSILYGGMPLSEVLFHPKFLFESSLMFVPLLLTALLIFVASAIYLINPREFLNLFAFPDLLKIREEILELSWTKGGPVGAAQLKVPWSWISSVRSKDYLYMGVIPMKVLELELSQVPANYSQYKLLEKVSRDGTYFFEPATNRMAKKFALCGIRLPLPLFAFGSDSEILIDYIQKKRGRGVLDASVLVDDNASKIESYTALWLEELSSKSQRSDLNRQLEPGASLQDGAYTITGILGTGGLSIVYQAMERQDEEHPVAIKEVVCNFGGTKKSVENNLKQLLTEVSILRKLNHPNIVQFKNFFAEGSKLYLVLDLVKGGNLRDYAESQLPLNEVELVELTRQCCSILEYLHSQSPQILHRDFTPDNLMINDGVVKLVDFNIAQAAVTSSSHTVMGKHCFMAPEQFCGESSVASDLYQLGTTLYFLATRVDPEPLTQCDLQPDRPDLSNEFRLLVRKLTEREPANRYRSASEVMQNLSTPSPISCTEAV